MDGQFKYEKQDRSIKGVVVSGLYNEEVEHANHNWAFHLNAQDIASPHSPSLLGISLETSKKSHSNLPGYQTKTLLQGSMLPQFEKFIFEMGAFDNKVKYTKVVRMSAHYHDSSQNPLFFIHKLSGSFMQPKQQAYIEEYNCISNRFQCGYTAVADNNGNINAQGKVNVAKTPILLSQVIPNQHTDIFNYNVKFVPREPRVYHLHYLSEMTQGNDRRRYLLVDYATWDKSMGKYVQVQGTINLIIHSHSDCKWCHTLEIKHPRISFTSISKRAQVYHEEKWLDINYSVLYDIPLPVIVKYYMIHRLEKGLIQMGYKIVLSKQPQQQKVAIVKYAFLTNVIDCHRTVSHGDDVQNMTCMIDIPLLNTYIDFKSFAEGLVDGPKLNLNASLEAHGLGRTMKGSSSISKVSPQNYQWITEGMHGWTNDMKRATEFDITMTLVKNDQAYDINGKWETINKLSGETQVLRIAGSSHVTQHLRDLVLNVMCDETSDRVCNSFKLNKENWIEYERRVEEDHFDRVVVTKANGLYTLTVDFYATSTLGLKKLLIAWENGLYEFELISTLLNASYIYDNQNIISVSYSVNTPITSSSFFALIDEQTIQYDFMYDYRKLGGVRFKNSAFLNLNIVLLNEDVSGDFMWGVSPESIGWKVRIPNFTFDWERTSDITEPTPYEKYIDIVYEPGKMTVNKFVWVLWERSFEMSNTDFSLSFDEGRFSSFDVKHIYINMEAECQESKPVVITGNVKITPTVGLIKISDPDRIFVCDVDINTDNLKKQHIEFNWHFIGAQVELLWNIIEVPDRSAAMICKVKISTKSWRTKSMSPIIDLDIESGIMATVKPNNFPTVSAMWKFAHALPIWFIPTENTLALHTVHSMTHVTTMTYLVKFNKHTFTESHMDLNGCDKEYTMAPGYTVCWPNSIRLVTTTDIPHLMRCVHAMNVRKDDDDEWLWSNTLNVTSPLTGSSTSTATTSMDVKVLQWKPSADHKMSIPTKIDLTHISADIPAMYDRLLLGWYHPIDYQYSDIIIESGHARINNVWTDHDKNIDLTGSLRRRGSTVEIPVILKYRFTRTSVSFNSTIIVPEGRMSHSLDASYVPNIWGWTFKHILDMPR